jgi:hypothetical protein
MILAEQIANYLFYLDLGIYGSNTTEGNIYIDALPEGKEMIALYNKPGGRPDSKLGYQSAGIQILYRGTEDPISSMQVAEDIYFALYSFEKEAFIGGGYYIVSCLSQQSGPERIGQSQNGEYEYSMNFVIEYKK